MPAPMRTHSLDSIYVVIGTTRITGWGADGGVEIAPSSDLVEPAVGAGGNMVVSRLADNSREVTLTVMQDSADYLRMQEQIAAQRAAGAIASLPFMYYNSISGERLSSDRAVYKSRPTLTGNKTAAESVFVLILDNPVYTPPSA